MTMQGWRIEVREEIGYAPEDGQHDCFCVRRANGQMARLRLVELTLAPTVVSRGRPASQCFACADPLFETIYVSRPVTDAEADTLRELLDAEMRREREEQQAVNERRESLAMAPPKSFTISHGFDAIEAGQAVTLAPDGTARPVVTWTAPTVRATEAERAQVKAALERLSSEWCAPVHAEIDRAMNTKALVEQIKRHIASGELKGAPRIETEQVAAFLGMPSARADRERAVPLEKLVSGAVYYTHIAGWLDWGCPKCGTMIHERKPDASRFICGCGFDSAPQLPAAPRVPQVGDEIEVFNKAHGKQGAWLRYKVAQVASGPELRGFTGLPPSDFIALDTGEELHGEPLLFALPVDSDGWRWPQ